MALAAIEHPTPVHLLADAVDLLQAAARVRPRPSDPATVRCLRALLRDLLVAAGELEDVLAAASPTPLAVVPVTDAGEGRPVRPGSLQVVPAGAEVRVRGRGPTVEGDLVRAALHHRAGATGGPAQEHLGALLWSALVALSRDGLDPPTALPTPLGVVGRTG